MNGFRLVLRALITGPARRRPARALLPVLGVAIGVAAGAAIHHANRSVTHSFREAANAVSGRAEFVVTGVAGVRVEDLAGLAFLWRIGSFAPAVTGTAVIDDGTKEIVQILGVDWGGDTAVRDIRLLAPTGPAARALRLYERSILVSEPFAVRHALSPGKTLRIIAGGAPALVTVGGILELSGVARAFGGDIVVTDLFTAQTLLGKRGRVDRVDIVLEPGVSREETAREIARRLPADLTLEPPGRAAATADRMVRAFRFNLNALASLTLLVGLFLIANAISITVLRRRPEIATLRALGASRSSIFAAFLAEGLAIGAAGTVLGEWLGLFASRAALAAVAGTVSSVYLPTARISGVSYSGAVALTAVVGMAASLAATIFPAMEAARVEPAPAMRVGSIEAVARRHVRWRVLLAAAAVAAALAAARAGPVDGFPLFGFAAVGLVVAALALAAPLLVRQVAALPRRILGRFLGAPGRLAAGFFGGAVARNGVAVTALAMALGMTLAMIVTVASIRETVRVWVESTLRSDLWIKADTGGRSGIVGDLPGEVLSFVQSIDGVEAVDPFRTRETMHANGLPFTVASGDFGVVARAGGVPMLDGRDPRRVALEARERGEVLVSEPYSRRFGAAAGGAVTLGTPKGRLSFRIAGVYRDYSNDRGTVVMDRALYLSLFSDPRITSLAVLARPGEDIHALRRRILAAAQGRYAVSISTNRELRREVLAIFDRTFAVTRALEAIAIVVAVLGIANALMASAVERRRSFGLLRAIGASRSQIQRATLLEAALTASTGTVAAMAAGAAFAWLLLGVINPQSFGWTVSLRVPGWRLFAASALVLAASGLAGIVPGRVAASVDPAAALQEE